MSLLGIDYGTKKVGLAVSDETETIAMPLAVLPNSPALLGAIGKVVAQRGIVGIVIGESKNLKWQDNPLIKRIHVFADELKKTFTVPITFEPEFFTTVAAKYGSEGKMIDASAAALILQSFLDKRHKKKELRSTN